MKLIGGPWNWLLMLVVATLGMPARGEGTQWPYYELLDRDGSRQGVVIPSQHAGLAHEPKFSAALESILAQARIVAVESTGGRHSSGLRVSSLDIATRAQIFDRMREALTPMRLGESEIRLLVDGMDVNQAWDILDSRCASARTGRFGVETTLARRYPAWQTPLEVDQDRLAAIDAVTPKEWLAAFRLLSLDRSLCLTSEETLGHIKCGEFGKLAGKIAAPWVRGSVRETAMAKRTIALVRKHPGAVVAVGAAHFRGGSHFVRELRSGGFHLRLVAPSCDASGR